MPKLQSNLCSPVNLSFHKIEGYKHLAVMLHNTRLPVYAESILLTSLNTRSKSVTRSVSNILLLQIFISLPLLGCK